MLKTSFCQDLQIGLMGKCAMFKAARHLSIRVILWGGGGEGLWSFMVQRAFGCLGFDESPAFILSTLHIPLLEVLPDVCLVGFFPPVTFLIPGALQPGSDCGSTFTTASRHQPVYAVAWSLLCLSVTTPFGASWSLRHR